MLVLGAAGFDLGRKTEAEVVDEGVEEVEDIGDAALDVKGWNCNLKLAYNLRVQILNGSLTSILNKIALNPRRPKKVIKKVSIYQFFIPRDNQPAIMNATFDHRNVRSTKAH